MNLRDRRALKDAARSSLASAPCDPKKLILIHTGISVVVSLLATLVNFLLGQQIDSTGGLSGLSTRSMLTTAQSALQLIIAVILPFWEAGYLYAAINISRGKSAQPTSLLEGFRRFGPLLRCSLLQWLIYCGVGIVCMILASQIFLMTPLANPLYEIAASLPEDSMLMESTYVLDEATQAAILDTYAPMMLIFLGLFLAGMWLVSYQFRMCNYLILDHPETGALAAIRGSHRQMVGNKAALFRLDLSFWWYYVLQTFASILAYGDYLLALFGVSLPISATAAFFLFLGLSLVGQFGLYVWARNRVEVTYAKVYDLTALPIPQKSKPTSQNIPWNY